MLQDAFSYTQIRMIAEFKDLICFEIYQRRSQETLKKMLLLQLTLKEKQTEESEIVLPCCSICFLFLFFFLPFILQSQAVDKPLLLLLSLNIFQNLQILLLDL